MWFDLRGHKKGAGSACGGMKRLAAAMAAVLCLLPGCGRREKNLSIRMDLSSAVTSVDPQFATSAENQLIMNNIFEGLLIRGEKGELLLGAAEEYSISRDGLVYTFRLRKDGVWNDANPKTETPATPVTAKDFVFSFHRIFDPEVPSPLAGDFGAIRNAEEVLAGELPKEQLGVKALGEYVLQITLSRPSPILLEQLAGPGAFPCNEEFFRSTRARYGQNASYILGNGPFVISSWDEEAVVLSPSKGYTGSQKVLCPSVVVYTGRAERQETTEWELFLDGKADFCPADSRQAEGEREDRFTLAPAEDMVWALIFRQGEGSPLADRDIRRGFVLAIDRESFGERVPEGFLPTQSLVPHSAALMGVEYRELAKAEGPGFLPEEAAASMEAGLARLELEAMPKTTLILPKSSELGALGGYLQKIWQQQLRQFINLEILEDGEFQRRMDAGEFEIAIAPLKGESGTPMGALGAFTAGNSRNLAGYRNEAFDLQLAQAQAAPDTRTAAEGCAACEEILLEDAVAMPLFTQQGYCAIANGLTGLRYRSGGKVHFAGVQRSN